MSLAPEDLELARPNPGDLPGIVQLYRETIQPVWDEHGRSYDLERIEENIRQRLASRDYWMTVARQGNTLLGYLAWEKHPDHTSHHVVAHLRMILVHPDTQGAGLGKFLMARFEASARAEGCTKILFDVVVGSPAYDFYRSRGYRHWSNYMEKFLNDE